MKTVSIKNLAIVHSKRNAYRIHFSNINKDDAINIMHNSNLIDKKVFIIFLYKMSEITYYQRNRDIILNRAKEYYKNNKEFLRERAQNKYRSLSEVEKDIRNNIKKIDIIT